jgi:hypothetical protein
MGWDAICDYYTKPYYAPPQPITEWPPHGQVNQERQEENGQDDGLACQEGHSTRQENQEVRQNDEEG